MMKLGTQTGSLINHLMSTEENRQPITVGMGATPLSWSDRHAATVIGWDGRTVTVQADNATRVDGNGMSDAQRYEYSANPDGATSTFRRDRKGNWREVHATDSGRFVFAQSGRGLLLGDRMHFYDFGF